MLLVGIVALVIFGPRKIPELARKAGKMMAEFRKVSDEFRSTWEREALLDEDEKKAFDFSDEALAREPSPPMIEEVAGPEAFEEAQGAEPPEVREITEEEEIERLKSVEASESEDENDKENWL